MNDRIRLVSVIALIALGAVACADPSSPASPASPTPAEPPTDLESARAAWTAADVGSYELHVTTMCFCPNEGYRIVVDADLVEVTYDDVGVPERIYIDRWDNAIDEEITYEIGFTDLP